MERRGFTLVELLVVLAVGSILLAIAVPGYGFLVNTSRVAAVTNDLISTLQLARSEAVKRGVRVTVCKTSNPANAMPVCDNAAGWHEGWLVFADGGNRGILDAQDELIRIEQDHLNGTRITPSNFHDYVSFLPSGMSQGPNNLGNGTFEICLEHMQRKVIVSVTGRIRSTSGSC